ncbi:hypothetical protein MesoLjLc_48500 [Mesorhizobium sp. L-8-10]|uniref:hypothetical protein n=1 Tax=unclassified Mesorhizobium TaxID=325217 RepID=UPI00192881A0|nr:MULTISPECIES: hypothetical protein [unclassified Mesorhizobium]BCH25163.1 hypothetical protein MesoLjLb_49480 [Mesorhizobium sp. L-8-3]BCH32920.1 hypothetical protein MesoLjLc_48500 [Mesorhizobium sp. L-8-10]
MKEYLEIMTEVIRLLTFQERLDRSWENDPARREDRSTDGDRKLGAGHGPRRKRFE